MSQRDERVRTLDTDEFAHGDLFSTDRLDPRYAFQ